MRLTVHRLVLLLTALAVALGGAVAVTHLGSEPGTEALGECPPGYQHVDQALAEVRKEMADEGEYSAAEREREADKEGGYDDEFVREAQRELPLLRGTDPETWESLCLISKRPESLAELTMAAETRAMPRLAPFGAYADGAYLNATREAQTLTPGSVRGTAGRAVRWGKGPLVVDSPDYPQVNSLGLSKNMGRIDDFAFDPKGKRLFAAVGNGGIWRSDDMAAHWRNANGNLPTTVTGAVAWSSYKHGTLLALTGEPTFGSNAYTGLGAYWSRDLGRHWHRAKGLPSGALGFRIAVDPQHPRKVYAATQRGLFRSLDGGRSYRNVKLPTGPCKGVTNVTKHPECAVANAVTDVVVAKAGGVSTDVKPGTVLAVVGWRGGQKKNADGSVQSPRNGLYRSASGKPGSFKKLATSGFAAQDAIGRVEMGAAVGPDQDHDIVYALVQDANLLNDGGVVGVDVPEESPVSSPVGTTVLNGLYVTTDFGKTWSLLASGTELASDPAAGSALWGVGTAIGYQPGVQGWYNLWVKPDPTRAAANGAPTRLAFGLEELWSNDVPQVPVPLDGTVPVHFRVVGKYFGGNTCLMLNADVPVCPGDREPLDDNSTTHPDQQDGIWIPDSSVAGGVQLVVGNDGGAYRYRFENDSDGELDNSNWGPGDQNGFYTLMPYHAAMANDGTVYAGLQDNGNLKIDGKSRKQFETYGGDGFFAEVDPFNSKVAYEEYTNGAMSVTTDGGTSWKDIDPGLTASKFSNPFTMDLTDANHLLTAGREVVETLIGPSTTSGMTDASSADATTTSWIKVFDLGTRSAPGDASASSSATDPNNSMSAVATRGNASYVAFCGQCDTLNKLSVDKTVFKNGLATNVGGGEKPRAGTSRGWHIAKAKGLPNRYITSIAIDPKDNKRIFVTLGGYTRRWFPPGAAGDVNKQLGVGHLFVSTNAGRSFTNVSGNLPDAPATAVALRKNQLLVGTDVGVFASGMRGAQQSKPKFARLGGLPNTPVGSITLRPNNPNLAVIAQFGSGVWGYRFDNKVRMTVASRPSTPAIGKVVKSWDFESGSDAWTASGFPTGWTLGSPGHASGTDEDASGNAWSVSGPTGYIDGMDTTVTSPAFTVSKGTYVVQWYMRLNTESYDPVSLEWSADGSTWAPLATYAGNSGDLPGWTKYGVILPAPSGDIQLRFHFTSDELCSGAGGPLCASPSGWDGVHVDDVTVGTLK